MDALAVWGRNALTVLEIVCGIGFLILVHELGHFVLAKLHNVKVEVFSLGMGPVLCSWRRGLGFRRGSSVKEYEEVLQAEAEGTERMDLPGETEYRLSWLLPLGGYVKMAGEPFDSLTGDPRELGSKSTGVRLQIFAAGAVMNLLCVFPICVAMYLVGKVEALPVVGDIEPGRSEWASGLQKGDVLLSVDGQAVRSIQEYREKAILADPGTRLSVRVLRPRAGTLPRWDRWLSIAPDGTPVPIADAALGGGVRVRSAGGTLAPSIEGASEVTVEVVTHGSEGYGVSPFTFPIVGAVLPGSSAAAAGLREGDQVLEIDGQGVRGFEHLQEVVKESAGKQLSVLVRGADGALRTLAATPKKGKAQRILDVDAVMAPVADEVKGGSPGERAGIRSGDRILAVDDRETPSWGSLVATVKGLAGEEASIRVLRGNEEKTLTATVGTDPELGRGLLGVTPRYGDTFAAVPPGAPWGDAGFQKGDILKKVAGKDVEAGFVDLFNAAVVSKEGEAIDVVVQRGSELVTVRVTPTTKAFGELGIARKLVTVEKAYGLGEAVTSGLGDGVGFMRMTLLMFKKLALRHESAKGLAGPVGIVKASYSVAQEGLGNFLWFLGLITVSLGVFNLLPIPLLDGGHIALMLVGLVRGKPLSEKALNRALWVGLTLIVSLIIFVTINDLTPR